ncbi:hypothetical protein [Streptomyces sp. NBC_00140]|uniref:hypothetical protein n=1 Tax=Streptomyces sp. NBC_00140 TaxID=2975664 RepID=UPI002252E5FB|nr:hypothetical protein [Streptomyces sp. NBC_00140]MCX5328296.1 hypothetical protein [Streptomyces sp. NBC_00140]
MPGDDRGDTASADRGDHIGLTHRMTGGELTLGAVLARLGERLREITAQAEAMREQVAQLTAQLDEPGRAAEEVRITRTTLLGLPAPPAPKLPDHPAHQQIMAVFTAAEHPLRARQVCEPMDLAVAPNVMHNVRLKLKRLASRAATTGPASGKPVHPGHVRSVVHGSIIVTTTRVVFKGTKEGAVVGLAGTESSSPIRPPCLRRSVEEFGCGGSGGCGDIRHE